MSNLWQTEQLQFGSLVAPLRVPLQVGNIGHVGENQTRTYTLPPSLAVAAAVLALASASIKTPQPFFCLPFDFSRANANACRF